MRRSSLTATDATGLGQGRQGLPLRPETAVSLIGDPAWKRILDVVVAIIGLVLSAPLWVAIAVAIKLEDRGPVLYRQRRWGRGGQVFSLHKFRTMKVDDASDPVRQATEKDGRVTRIGQVLRASGMDELPQLINILRGDMTFVGPRALAVGEIANGMDGLRYEDVPGFWDRLAVRPGLTGVSTIYLPRDVSPTEKFAHDLRYISERSPGGDVKLIALSLWISVRGRWETRSSKL